MRVKNSKGAIYYGMHFYPGVAEYAEPDKAPYRVFLNENTIRTMDATFAGRPVFVYHVDGVEENLDTLRGEADGWVIKSFYNEADGKHWVQFIVCSERGERAVKSGMRLSNCYIPKTFSQGGLWNGVSYSKEITGGEYEHLAIVPNPRYDESVIMTPDEFKRYNNEHIENLKRLANNKKGSGSMAFKLFKRTKVENSVDLEGMIVVLPKSGKEVPIAELVQNADESEEKKKKEGGALMADPEHHVNMNGLKMTVNELMEKHKAVCDELADLKGDKARAEQNDDDDDGDSDDGKKTNQAEADAAAAAAKAEADAAAAAAAAEKKANDDRVAAEKKAAAKKKAEAVANAGHDPEEVAKVEFLSDQIARGQQLFGS